MFCFVLFCFVLFWRNLILCNYGKRNLAGMELFAAVMASRRLRRAEVGDGDMGGGGGEGVRGGWSVCNKGAKLGVGCNEARRHARGRRGRGWSTEGTLAFALELHRRNHQGGMESGRERNVRMAEGWGGM